MATSLALSVPHWRARRSSLCGLIMLLGDLLALALALSFAVILRQTFQGQYELSLYWREAPILVLFVCGYALFGAYPGIAISAAGELRQLTLSSTLVFILLGTLMFLSKQGNTYSRLVFLIGWAAALVLVPSMRSLLRMAFCRRSWWGYPVAVLGAYATAKPLIETLRERPELGFHPIGLFAEDHQDRGADELAIPLLGSFQQAPAYAREMGLRRAIVALPGISQGQLERLMESQASHFSRVYVISALAGFSSLGIATREVGNSLALEVRRNLLLPSHQFLKRLVDQVLSTLACAAGIPLALLIALLIKLDSPGTVFFRQKRIGYGGKVFSLLKFRTMYSDGGCILEEHFRQYPAARLEWAESQKLRGDPRLTRVGKILRKLSLDELPQLWNVLCGDMSLVGPRPIVQEEVQRYGECFALYSRVLPGLTGLWQVSGRNDLEYGKRVELDSYYVRNWSPWLDLYILARTVYTVVSGEGSY